MIGLRGIPASWGGVERAVEELSAGLVQRGHSVTVYARSAYADPTVRTHRGVAVNTLPQLNTKHLEAASHTALSLLDVLRARNFDVVHLHATGPGLFSVLLRIARIPCVVTVQGLDWQREKWGRAASAVLRLGARMSATVPHRTIVVSRGLEHSFIDHYGRQAVYVPNGVNLDGLRAAAPVDGLQSGEFVLYLGRLVPEKGVHTLIEAFRSVNSSTSLAICGPSSHSDDYVRMVRDMARADERIVFLGARYGKEKAWLLQNAAVFVQPSSVEGLPITLLEALACGRFTVVSDIPENVEVITGPSRPVGLVFRTGEAGDLAQKLQAALAYSDREGEGREASQQVQHEYDWDRIVTATEAVYREAIDAAAGRRWTGRCQWRRRSGH